MVIHPQAHTIVCLEHQAACLYAEVIQILEARQRGWLRPLLLKRPLPEQPLGAQPDYLLYNLQSGADLLWPLTPFRLAVDTELIPLLGELHKQQELAPATVAEARSQLDQFVHQIWQDSPESFPG